MEKDMPDWTPENVEARIDRLAHLAQQGRSDQADTQLVKDLYTINQADERIVQNVHDRLHVALQEHKKNVENTHNIQEISMEGSFHTTPGIIQSKDKRTNRSFRLLSTMAAIVVAAILVGSLITILTVQQKQQQAKQPTATPPAATTPAEVQKESTLYVVKGDGVYDINLKDDKTLWQYPFDVNTYQVSDEHLSSDQQTLYVLLYNRTEISIYLDAFDLKGQTHKWHVKIADNLVGRQMVEADNSLYISTSILGGSDGKSKVYALNAADGSQRWSIEADGSLGNVANGLLYTSLNGKLQTYKVSDGTPSWSITLDTTQGNFSTTPYVVQNNLYIVSCASTGLYSNIFHCNLHAYNASNGDAIWQSQSIDGPVSGDGSGSGLIISGNHAYTTTGAGDICSFELQNGTQLWKQHIGTNLATMGGSTFIIESQNVIYAGRISESGTQDTAAALNASTGQQIWSQQVSDDTHIQPMPRPIGVDEKQHLVYYWTFTTIQTRSATDGTLQHEYTFPSNTSDSHGDYISSAFLWSGK